MMMTNLANLLVSPDQYEVVATGEADEPLVSKNEKKMKRLFVKTRQRAAKKHARALEPKPPMLVPTWCPGIFFTLEFFTVKPMTTMNAPAGKIRAYAEQAAQPNRKPW